MKTRRTFIKTIAMLLIFSLLSISFFSCSSAMDEGGETINPTPSSEADNKPSETLAPSESALTAEGTDSALSIDQTSADANSAGNSLLITDVNSAKASSVNSIEFFRNGSYNFKIVRSALANSFDKTYCNYIASLFEKLTGVMPEIVTDAVTTSGPAILVGKTRYAESTAVYNGLSTNQSKSVLSGNKYAIAYTNESSALLLYNEIKIVLVRNSTENSVVIDSKWNFNCTYTPPATSSYTSNTIFVTEQKTSKLVFYDFNLYQPGKTLDDLRVKSISIGSLAGLKYRENTIFGNVIIVAGGDGSTGIYDTSGGKIWSTSNPGNNPHSVEILPSGNLVVASSTGDTVRLFTTSALKNGGSVNYYDYTLDDAHGVLWDPAYNRLWALGNSALNAYSLSGSGTGERLVYDASKSITLPSYFRGGHDLSPDYTNTRYLYLSLGGRVVKFDKSTKTMDTLFTKTPDSVKGFSNNPAGNIFFTGQAGMFDASWITNTIHFWKLQPDGSYEKIMVSSSTDTFYKSRVYCGSYQ